MSNRILKSFVTHVVGALSACLDVFGYNPVVIGMYTAIQTSRLIKWPAFFIMSAVMYWFKGILVATKYAMIMFSSTVLIALIRDKNKKVNEFVAAGIGAILYGGMEIADVYMSGKSIQYELMLLLIIMTFSSSVAVSRILEAVEMSGKKQNRVKKQKIDETMGKIYEEKISSIAASFDRMSKSISQMGSAGDIHYVDCADIAIPQIKTVNDIWRGKMEDSRNAIAIQLSEMSRILKDCTSTSYVFVDMGDEREKAMRAKLKNLGLWVKKIVVLNNRRGISEVNITLRSVRNKCVTVKMVENAISECFEKKYRHQGNKGNIVKCEYDTYNFVEETNYFLLHGVAKRGKDGASVTGDNFSCMELQNGQTLLSISDGMGHGLNAYKESEMVMSLLEELIDGGFSEEAALRLINTVFMVDECNVNPATLDMSIVDMYSGVCDFIKIGAATTFIKRGGWVEAIRSDSMPMGVDNGVDMETTSKKLFDGDYIIMVSDGVVEAAPEPDRERFISSILMDIKTTNPQEMAEELLSQILQQENVEHEDDMMVMVAGIWDKCA